MESHLIEHLEQLKRDYLLALLPAASAPGNDDLHVVFEARSPLHLVLSPAILARYDELFQFMLRLKRVGSALQTRLASRHPTCACTHIRPETTSSGLRWLGNPFPWRKPCTL